MSNLNLESNYDWYVLNTLTGREESIKLFLEFYFPEKCLIKNPQKKMPEWKRGEFRENLKQLFSGYLFLLIEKNSDASLILNEIENCKKKNIGIVKLLYEPDTAIPAKLTSEEIKKITMLINEQDIVEYTIGLKNGDEVSMISGPFKDQIGKIVKINWRKFKITVVLNFLGLQTIDLPFTYVEKTI